MLCCGVLCCVVLCCVVLCCVVAVFLLCCFSGCVVGVVTALVIVDVAIVVVVVVNKSHLFLRVEILFSWKVLCISKTLSSWDNRHLQDTKNTSDLLKLL